MDYQSMNVEAQRGRLLQRLADLEQEHFDNDIARDAASARGDDAETARLEDNLAVIEQAHAAVKARLDTLPTATPAAAAPPETTEG